MEKYITAVCLLAAIALAGCASQAAPAPSNAQSAPPQVVLLNEPPAQPANDLSVTEKLRSLAEKEFSIAADSLSQEDYPQVIAFGQSFVDLYTGAVAEQHTVSFEHYIASPTLLKFADTILRLEQKKEVQGGIGVIFGMDNTFKEPVLEQLDDNLVRIKLPFENKGSGMQCTLLVQAKGGRLTITDLYFGIKDGADTIATGHPAERKVQDPALWDSTQWSEPVFEKLAAYEAELLACVTSKVCWLETQYPYEK